MNLVRAAVIFRVNTFNTKIFSIKFPTNDNTLFTLLLLSF